MTLLIWLAKGVIVFTGVLCILAVAILILVFFLAAISSIFHGDS